MTPQNLDDLEYEPLNRGPLVVAGYPNSTLTDAGGRVSVDDAVDVVRTCYGVLVAVSRLSGERDDNFRAHTGVHDWMLKIAHVKEDVAVTECQSAILEHLEGSSVQVPHLVPTLRGHAHEWITDGPAEGRAARMTTFLAGAPLRATPVTAALAVTLGHTVAELDAALADFSHPGTDVELLWDLQQAHRTRELIAAYPHVDGTGLLLSGLDKFVAEVAPRLERLPKQVIHNDFNPDNVLISGDRDPVVSVLDFGDAVIAPRVVDLAVAAAYHVGVVRSSDLLDSALEMVAGYHEHSPLTEEEIDLIYELILARVVTAISIASWRATRFPDNHDYIVRNTATAWNRLHLLLAADPAVVTDQIKRRCEPR